MSDPASITLSNGTVVRVGDVVPMTDGTMHRVARIDNDPGACLYLIPPGEGVWHYRDGKPNVEGGPSIHFGVFSTRAALAQPARAQAEDVMVTEAQRREIAEAWQDVWNLVSCYRTEVGERMAVALGALGGSDV